MALPHTVYGARFPVPERTQPQREGGTLMRCELLRAHSVAPIPRMAFDHVTAAAAGTVKLKFT